MIDLNNWNHGRPTCKSISFFFACPNSHTVHVRIGMGNRTVLTTELTTRIDQVVARH